MVHWTHDIPPEPRGNSLPIRRTPAARPLQAIATSRDLIGCYTHFWHGSTVPCERPDCPACQDGLPFRWHAYLSAVDVFNHLHFIFEVTALGAQPFTQYRDLHGTLRGCQFIARRWRNRTNGRILIATKPADLKEVQIPEPPDLEKCMAIIWSLPSNGVQTTSYNPENRMPQVAKQAS
jgi:hypothetical protein